MAKPVIDFSTLRRALVVKLRNHGDVLLTSPVFSVLRSHAPQLEIDALVYDDTREMLTFHPAISEVHAVPRKRPGLSLPAKLAEEMQLLSKLRARRYDLLMNLAVHPSAVWLSWFLRPRYSIAPEKENFASLWRRNFSHIIGYPRGPHRHQVELNLDALRCLGVFPGAEERRLVLVPGEEAKSTVSNRIAALGLRSGQFILIHPTSRWAFKCSPAKRTAQLIEELVQAGESVVLTAAPNEPELALVRAIRAACRVDTVDLSGQLTLKQLAALIGDAKLFIGVDSAPMHMAAAMGTPVVAQFGPSSELAWGPWGVRHRVVASDVHHCRPCRLDGCGGSKVSDCLTTLPVARVLAAARELLADGGNI
jgi:heptosyltransferase-3